MNISLTTFAKKIILSLIIIVNFSFLTLATDQIPDLLIYGDETYYINGIMEEDFPLYELLNMEKYASKMDKYDSGYLKLSGCSSSACHRNYQAVWELKNGYIYLKQVLDCCTGEPIMDLEKVFGELVINNKVRAFWINRKLSIYSVFVNSSNFGDNWKAVTLKIEKGQIRKK